MTPSNEEPRPAGPRPAMPAPERLSLITTLWLAFALRVWRLGDKAIWWDEGLAVWAVRKPFLAATRWTAGDVHPPLFFWTLWAWIRAAGQTEFALRFITLAWGVIAVALVWALARRLGGPRAGAAAGLIAAISPYMVEWSQELRMYMLAALAVLVAVYAALRWLGAEATQDERSSRRWLVAQLLGSTAALYTVYLTAIALVAINLAVGWIWLRERKRDAGAGTWTNRRLIAWSSAQITTILLFLPWWLYASERMQSWSSIQKPSSLAEVFTLAGTLLATGQSVNLSAHRGPTLAFWGALALGLGYLAWARKRGSGDLSDSRDPSFAAPITSSDHRLPLMLLLTLLPPLAVWAATQPRSIFYAPNLEARYFVPFALPVYAAAGWAVARLADRRRLLAGALIIGLLGAMWPSLSAYHAGRHRVDDYASMALAIWTQYEPGDAVLFTSGDRYPLFLYHYDRPWDQPAGEDPYRIPSDEDIANDPSLVAAIDGSDRPVAIPFPSRAAKPLGQNDWQELLDEIIAEHDRVWLAEVERHHQDPDFRIRTRIADAVPSVFSERYQGDDALYLFSKNGEAPQLTHLSASLPGVRRLEVQDSGGEGGWLGLVAMPNDTIVDPERFYAAAFSRGVLTNTTTMSQSSAHARLRHQDQGNAFPYWEESSWRTVQAPGRHRVTVDPSDALPSGNYRMEFELFSTVPGNGLAQLSSATVPISESPETEGVAYVLAESKPVSIARSPVIRVSGGLPPAGQDAIRIEPRLNVGGHELEHTIIAPVNIRAGERMSVDLYWRGLNPAPFASITESDSPSSRSGETSGKTSVFVHAIGPDGTQFGDDQSMPWPLLTPSYWAKLYVSSTAWIPDRRPTVFDRHVLHFPEDAPPGEYTILTGLYDPETGERWPVKASGEGTDPAVSIDGQARTVRLGTVRLR